MQNIYDLAVLELAELLASARNAGAPCQPARQQDEHGPAGDEEKEEFGVHGLAPKQRRAELDQRRASKEHQERFSSAAAVCDCCTKGREKECKESRHGSVPSDVVVNQEHADHHHSGSAYDGEAEKSIEAHLSLLLVVTTLREPEIEAVANHADRDGAEDEDEEGHGLSLGAALGGDWALAAALVQVDQSLTKREARTLCCAGGKVTDRGLLAVANSGDVYLPEVADPKVGDE